MNVTDSLLLGFWLSFFLIDHCYGSSALSCFNSYECAYLNWSDILQDIWYSNSTNSSADSPFSVNLNGYKSGINSRFIPDRNVRAQGVYSGSLSNITGKDNSVAECSSTLGCAKDATIQSVSIKCRGVTSCFESNIHNPIKKETTTLSCNGESSCGNSDIFGYKTVIGYGAYSLAHSRIKSRFTESQLQVILIGLNAGYGLTVECLFGMNCDIICYGNACVNLTLICLGGCTYYIDCSNTEAKYCPTFDNNTKSAFMATETELVTIYKDNNDSERLTTLGEVYGFRDDAFMADFSMNRDVLCGSVANTTNDSMSVIIDDTDSYLQNRIKPAVVYQSYYVGDVCIRAYKGSYKAHGISIYNSNSSNVFDTSINGINVLCSAAESCSGIKNGTRGIELSENSDLYCSGDGSCQNSVINGVPGANTIHCGGTTACKNSSITNGSTVYCSGGQSCADSVIKGVNNVYSLGADSIANAVIYSPTAATAGNATVASSRRLADEYSSVLNIYMYGVTYAYVSMDIFCLEGDTCTIECIFNTSCNGINMYCDGNCTVVCDDDYNCPDVTYGSSVIFYLCFFFHFFCFLDLFRELYNT